MSNNWKYDLRCEKCNITTTYAAFSKDKHSWYEFYKVLMTTDWNNNYNYCEKCDMWTKQILLSFDKGEQNEIISF